jgi:DNA-binding NarL/FixJ family response regulator
VPRLDGHQFQQPSRATVAGTSRVRGKSNAEIGRDLYMSIATVKAHVSRLLEKLKFNNRVQIALLAHDAGEA